MNVDFADFLVRIVVVFFFLDWWWSYDLHFQSAYVSMMDVTLIVR